MWRDFPLLWFAALFLLVFSAEVTASRSSRVREFNKTEEDGKDGVRRPKFLSVFQVIRFANDMCPGSGTKTGTCFTEQECSAKGGVNAGSCASGFGVCCVVTINCGATSSENCTYFDSSEVEAGGCQATICPCNDNICQLRLDFESFTIAGPSTDANPVTKRIKQAGVVATTTTGNMGVPVTEASQCLTDTFTVSNSDGPNPPTICGINTGEHMYVESNDCCNDLTFQLGMNGIGTGVPNRAWSIKVTQFSCEFNNLAPQGCVQYFFDVAMDNIQSFNYNNGAGAHLANQDQQICIRREMQYCRICYEIVNNGEFDVSGVIPDVSSLNTAKLCCGYGTITSALKGFDCLHIPGALNKNARPNRSNFCGNNKFKTTTKFTAAGLVPMSFFNTGMVCSVRTPFTVNFRSDLHEVPTEAGIIDRGFTIQYTMDAIDCDATALMGVGP